MPRRLRPEQHPGIDLRVDDPRIVWAKSAKASSEWSSSYGPRGACGKPTIYPEGGDLTPSWLAANDDARPWIDLTFPDVQTVEAIIVCETCGPGAVISIEDLDAQERLYDAPPETIAESREARLLVVPLEPRTPPRRLRLRLAPYSFGSEYHEIDAVGLVRVPFDELAQPYVPPPPRPEPEDLLTRMSGTLLGVSRGRPVTYFKLRHRKRVRAFCRGGPLRLRLEDGTEVDLEIGETALYGGPLIRARGPWDDIAREHPELLAAMKGSEPALTDEVVLELRWIDRERSVEVAGDAVVHGEGGFRDAASGPPRSLVARAISLGPLAASAFATEGLDGFAVMPDRPTPVGAAHPLAGWQRGLTITSLVSGAALAGAAFTLALDHVLLAILSTVTAYLWIHTLELLGRRHAIPQLATLPYTGHHDRRPAFTGVGWTVTTSALGLVCGMPALAFSIFASSHPASGLLTMLAGCGVLALVRLSLWQRVQGSTFLGVLRAATAGATRRVGAYSALTGFLGPGEHQREEDYAQKIEHTGTETYTDANGRLTTRDTSRWWYERRLSVRGPREVTLHLKDGTPVRCEGAVRATDVSMVHLPTSKGVTNLEYARFRGAHDEGDEATLVGPVQSAGEDTVLGPSVLVLGSMRTLRLRVLAQLAALAGLVGFVALGGVCAFLLFA